jgi:hypothetical protein
MQIHYYLKLFLIGYVAFCLLGTFVITYNILKSRKIFLNQKKEIKEKYKPFYRNDVKNWCLWESILLGWIKIPWAIGMWAIELIVAIFILQLINWTKFN